jgi:FeS assembly SUF system regulator
MLKLSKMTDYAVILLADMADKNDVLLSATSLADTTKLPEPTVSKILKALARQNIIVSTRGANGGYRLDRQPNEINMADIITALEGPIALTDCVEKKSSCCERVDSCSMRGKWNPVNQAMQAALENVSLQQMMGGQSS